MVFFLEKEKLRVTEAVMSYCMFHTDSLASFYFRSAEQSGR